MKLINLFRQYQSVNYQNRILSVATLVTVIVFLIAAILPVIILSSRDLSTAESLEIYEQPYVKFNYDYLLLIESSMDGSVVACSSFEYLNQFGGDVCSKIKVQATLTTIKIIDCNFGCSFCSSINYSLESLGGGARPGLWWVARWNILFHVLSHCLQAGSEISVCCFVFWCQD